MIFSRGSKIFLFNLLLIFVLSAGGVFACTGVVTGQRAQEDDLFEQWVRVQLQGVQGWQASALVNDVRQPEVEKCLRQNGPSESDCVVHESVQYPLFFRLPNGYLMSSGFRPAAEKRMKWPEVEDALTGYSAQFGFDEQWRPCRGDACRFEVFTSYMPLCPGGKTTCGRAEYLNIHYVIKSRQPNRQLWHVYERLISNMDPDRKLEPLRFAPLSIVGVPPLSCRGPAAQPLSREHDGKLLCGLNQAAVHQLCANPRVSAWRLEEYGLCSFGGCPRVCERIRKAINKPCPEEKLKSESRSPDLFRCQGRSRLLYLSRPADFQERLAASREKSVFSRLLEFEVNFCLTRTVCFGAFKDQPKENVYEAFLEVR